MLLTPYDAQEKWCPHARVAGPPGSEAEGLVFNRWPGQEVVGALCKADACMSWRWAPGATWLNRDEQTRPKSHGYCGLSGTPDAHGW